MRPLLPSSLSRMLALSISMPFSPTVAHQLSRYKIPKKVSVVAALPLTTIGKLDKKGTSCCQSCSHSESVTPIPHERRNDKSVDLSRAVLEMSVQPRRGDR